LPVPEMIAFPLVGIKCKQSRGTRKTRAPSRGVLLRRVRASKKS